MGSMRLALLVVALCVAYLANTTTGKSFRRRNCYKPKKTGHCRGAFRRWYFNTATGRCTRFIYGGCRENGNNYFSKKHCEKTCGKPKTDCTSPAKTGPCRARMRRWFHNKNTGKCEQFTYGGCRGNRNNYNSKQECESTCGTPTSPPSKGCVCNKLRDPVCGADGKNYPNPCYAKCRNVKYTKGTCSTRPNCVCNRMYSPVCGTDGRTYSNPCVAACAQATIKHKGRCKSSPITRCLCSKIYKPVCGTNSKTYSNSCVARCARVRIKYHRKCGRKICPIPRIRAPVCGINGHTYVNRWAARCANIKIEHGGKCLDSDEDLDIVSIDPDKGDADCLAI